MREILQLLALTGAVGFAAVLLVGIAARRIGPILLPASLGIGFLLLVFLLVRIEPIPAALKVGAAALYGAGAVGVLELVSLVSRGYSLRILADLSDSGGTASPDRLAAVYGGGRGLADLLRSRLEGLVSVGLLQRRSGRYGPLTPLGRRAARLTRFFRGLLRLQEVG